MSPHGQAKADLTAADLRAAVSALRRGDLVAFPTETVYGLGADAQSPLAVRRIFAAKGRPAGHPLIVHLAATEDPVDAMLPWGRVDDRARCLARALWPGPLTLILPDSSAIDEVTGGLATVGVRVPAHPVAQALLRAFGGGIAAPSANRFGHISPTTAAHVRVDLAQAMDQLQTGGLLILDGGPSQVGIESTIVDLSGPQAALLRPGAITLAQLQALIGPVSTSGSTVAPGTLPGHYAPRTALQLSPRPTELAAQLRAQGLRVAVLKATEASSYARQLYAELRRLDALAVDVLVAQPLAQDRPGDGLAAAVNDRLIRAAHGSTQT